MGADFISYCCIGPIKLSASKKMRQKADQRVAKFIDLACHSMTLADDEVEEHDEELQNLARHPFFKHLELPEDVRWAQEYKGQPEKLVEEFLELWHGGSRDSDSRAIPKDKLKRKVVFTGDMSWGDEPDGYGFTMLKRADQSGLLDIYGVE